MKNNITLVKKKLDAAISQLREVSWMFSKKQTQRGDFSFTVQLICQEIRLT